MEAILRAAVQRGASDLHVKAGDVLRARVDGRLVPITRQPLTAEQTREIAQRLLPGDAERARLDTLTDYDCSYAVAGVGRFRVNIMRQRGTFSAVLRLIPHEVPTLEALGLPPTVARIAEAERGMILVTGVTGSGKSSTLAAMIRHVNARSEKHILTLENPVEFVHQDLKGSVTQREVGVDTESFRHGLRAALRQDPDVILIGEMRDAETVDTALKAAETGHLLLSTLHTPDAQSTILRTVAMFAAEEQAVVRLRLAESLHAVVSQRLMPHASGRGRVVAAEIMIVTAAIRDMIAEGRVSEIRDLIEEGRAQYGMQSFDQHLADLVRAEAVTYDVALAAATRPADFALQFRMLHAAAGPGPRGGVAAGAGAPSVAGGVANPAAPPGGANLPGGGGFDFLHG